MEMDKREAFAKQWETITLKQGYDIQGESPPTQHS